ncbi:hypothetical protein CMI47_04910 [Candidatus Pacearchaeota archaeon]|nr:hypothetical protein [Candidatus Pacearchaeota archaeon]|tara:strand:+ start:293 stop:1033 length:741 start_codon:yes stop_codon:yes gene_type:complete
MKSVNGISVITTLFNYANYIEECIDSIIRQESPGVPVEHIIIDDCSTDNPQDNIKKHLHNSSVKYFLLNENVGYSAAKNCGIKKSKYNTIVMLDADDYLTDCSLKIRYNKLIDGSFDLVHGPAYVVKNGKKDKISPSMKRWMNNKGSSRRWKHIHAQGVMLRKEIHSEIGLYDETMRCKSDREMWARIFNRKYKIGTVKNPVVFYRCHSKQMHRSRWKLKNNKKLTSLMEKKIEKRKKSLDGLRML